MFETWFRGGKEGNRIKILLCFTIYVYSSHIPKQVGPHTTLNYTERTTDELLQRQLR